MVNDQIAEGLEKAADVIICGALDVAGGHVSEHSLAKDVIVAFLRLLLLEGPGNERIWISGDCELVDLRALADAVEGTAVND